jgi:D-alanyl-D-alanine carboxypeptidase (penicillin-binding protein 5/6)
MENPELAKIMATKYYNIQGDRELRNHNRFLFTTPMAVGGKTGYTRASQHTYVGEFQNGGKTIIISMMGSKKKWADLRPLIEKGFELSGSPIAKMPPAEEKLWFPKSKYASSRSKPRLRRQARVITGSATGVVAKKKTGGNKKKSKTRTGAGS